MLHLIARGIGTGPTTPQQPAIYGTVLIPKGRSLPEDKKNVYPLGPSSYRRLYFIT